MVSSVHKKWGFVTSVPSSGVFNMAFDDHFARQENERSFLRFYSWSPYAVSIGYHQSSEIVDLKACYDDGVAVVRRPTGGRAIFHAEELTYSIVFREKELSLNEAYLKVHTAIASGLSKIGVHSELVNTHPNRNTLSPQSDKTTCFTASARTELEYNGKKIVGSAGKKYENSLLIHGSILLGNRHKEIIKYLNIDDAMKRLMRDELNAKTDNLSDILGRVIYPMELIPHLRDSFSNEFQIDITEEKTAEEVMSLVSAQEKKFEISLQKVKMIA